MLNKFITITALIFVLTGCAQNNNIFAETENSEILKTEKLDQVRITKLDPSEEVKMNDKLCENISSEIMQTWCTITKARQEKNEKICEQIKQTDTNYTMCFANVGVVKNDSSVCNLLPEKDRCLLIMAEDLNNISICNNITNEKIKESCKSATAYQPTEN